MRYKSLSLMLMVSGILTIIGSFIWINNLGLEGVYLTPLFYIIGPGLLFLGIIKEFQHREQGKTARSMLIVASLIVVFIAGIIIVNFKINEQQDSNRRCDAKFGYDHQAVGYLECLDGH